MPLEERHQSTAAEGDSVDWVSSVIHKSVVLFYSGKLARNLKFMFQFAKGALIGGEQKFFVPLNQESRAP